MSFKRVFLALGLCAAVLPMRAQATLFTGSSGDLSASADFTVVGGQLQLILTNTSPSDVLVPSDVLTAVFFNIAGDPAFTSLSALLGTGSSVVYGDQPYHKVVGGEWGYASGLSGAPGDANQGISAAGFGLFGQPTFPGKSLNEQEALGGLDYGIVSAGDDAGTGNRGVTKSPLIKNSVVFTLGNVPVGFDPATSITDVSFQYGTALTEPNVAASCSDCGLPAGGSFSVAAVPEPASVLLLAGGLLGLAGLRARRARRGSARLR